VERVGFYGFGAAAHILVQVARHAGCEVCAFTRSGEAFLDLAPRVPVRTEVHPYPLERANEALDDLRGGRFTGGR